MQINFNFSHLLIPKLSICKVISKCWKSHEHFLITFKNFILKKIKCLSALLILLVRYEKLGSIFLLVVKFVLQFEFPAWNSNLKRNLRMVCFKLEWWNCLFQRYTIRFWPCSAAHKIQNDFWRLCLSSRSSLYIPNWIKV